MSVGDWLRVNGESIYGVHRHNLMWNLWGTSTVSGNILYLHLQRYQDNRVIVGGLSPRVRRATLLSNGRKLGVQRRGHQTVISGLPACDPSLPHCVAKLELDGAPDQDISRVIGGADIFPDLPK